MVKSVAPDLQSKLLKGGYIADSIGSIFSVTAGDTRSLDYGSYDPATLTSGILIVKPRTPNLRSEVTMTSLYIDIYTYIYMYK